MFLFLRKLIIWFLHILGSCEDLRVDVSQSTGSGGRAWRNISYSVSMGATNVADITSLAAFLSKHGEGALTLNIPSTYLHADTVHFFTVLMCNFMGTCMVEEFSVYVYEVELPPVEISALPSQTYQRHQDILFEVPYYDTRTSSCPSRALSATSDSFEYQWSVLQSGVEKNEYASQSKVPTMYFLPSYTLPSSVLFELLLVVYDPSTHRQVSTSINIYIEPEEVVSVISGGDNIFLEADSSYTLDGSKSYDKEIAISSSASSTALSYLWYCVVLSPEYSSVCPLLLTDNTASKLEMDVGSIAQGTILRLYLRVTSTDGSARSHTSSTQLHVVHTKIPNILVNHMFTSNLHRSRTKFPARLKLNGTIVWPTGYSRSDVVAKWKYEDVWNDENDVSKDVLTPLQEDLSSTTAISNYFPFVLLTDSLPVQNEYTFTLSLYMSTSSLLITKSSITVYRNMPPSPGTLTASPSTGGVEMQTVYTLLAELWDDEDLPLYYKFTYVASSSQTVLQAKALSFSISTQLPAGKNDGTGTAVYLIIPPTHLIY